VRIPPIDSVNRWFFADWYLSYSKGSCTILIFNRNTAGVSHNLFGVLLVNISTVKYFRVPEKTLLKYLRHTLITNRKQGEPPSRLLFGPNN
jgi:hypothetical protein